MKYNSLKYSLKVWLTSVLIAPALAELISFLLNDKDAPGIFSNSDGVFFYVVFVIFGFAFSFITWLAFLLVIVLTTTYCSEAHLKKWLIFSAGVALTVGTFILIFGSQGLFSDPDGFNNLMYANCACIGWGVWFYRLDDAPIEKQIEAEE